jgi:hypothetical protein
MSPDGFFCDRKKPLLQMKPLVYTTLLPSLAMLFCSIYELTKWFEFVIILLAGRFLHNLHLDNRMGRLSIGDLTIGCTCIQLHDEDVCGHTSTSFDWGVFSALLPTVTTCASVCDGRAYILHHHASIATFPSCILHIGLHCLPESG